MTVMSVEPELRLQRRVGRRLEANAAMSTAFGITVTFAVGNAARDDVVAQALADRRDVIGAAQRDVSRRRVSR